MHKRLLTGILMYLFATSAFADNYRDVIDQAYEDSKFINKFSKNGIGFRWTQNLDDGKVGANEFRTYITTTFDKHHNFKFAYNAKNVNNPVDAVAGDRSGQTDAFFIDYLYKFD